MQSYITNKNYSCERKVQDLLYCIKTTYYRKMSEDRSYGLKSRRIFFKECY